MNINTDSKKLYYVGGCVRDEILGRQSLDIDICYEGDAIEFVENQGYNIIKTQKDIRTARVIINNQKIDFASTRKEIYPSPGHLPITTEIGCPLLDDLTRRDFTINSIAKSVSTGEIFDPTGGLNDIKAKLLRIHHKNSFKDDPTRILRALKFSLRFGFHLEENTRKLQEEYLAAVNYDMSYSRLKKELIDTFNLNTQEGLERFINEKISRLLTPTEYSTPKVNIPPLVEEFGIKDAWIVYIGWMDLSQLDLTKQEKKIIEDYQKLKNLPSNNDEFETYKLCKKSEIPSILLWHITTGDNRGLNYLRYQQNITLEINGEDVIKLGFSGKKVGNILESVLKSKLSNPRMTKSDELALAKTFS